MNALQFSASTAKFLVLKPLGALFPSLFYKGPSGDGSNLSISRNPPCRGRTG